MAHIALDLDGTVARYDGWRGVDHVGDPVEGVVTRVRVALAAGHDVTIFTARVSEEHDLESREAAARVIRRWCLRYLGQVLPITANKSRHFTEFWDDRAVRVEKNTGVFGGPMYGTLAEELDR